MSNFNQSAYINQFKKEHYKRISLDVSPADADLINSYCQDMGISKTAFLIAAAKYIIDNNIKPSEFLKK